MLPSPTTEQAEDNALPPTPESLPDGLGTPWQKMVSLLRTTMGVPVALLLSAPAPAMTVLVSSKNDPLETQSPDPSAALSLAEEAGRKMAISRTGLLVTEPHKGIACLAEPIAHPDGRLFGTLCVVAPASHPLAHRELLTEFGHTMEGHLALAETRRALAREQKKTTALAERLAREAATDPLTGLLNRHTFGDRFHQEVARHKRARHPLSLILCGLDRFREFNDANGQAEGDALLVTLARLFKERLRSHDLIWRWGGDTFFMLLPDTPLMGAVEVVESVRHLVEAETHGAPPEARVTLSAGVTNHALPESEEECLTRCNHLLEAAKQKGRNCVILG